MKTNKLNRFAMIVVALAFAAIPAMAMAGGGQHAGDFKNKDANGDGKLSPDEHAASAKTMFDTMDANKDGTVTSAEMEAAHEQIMGKKARKGAMSAADKIKVVDSDGDGKLTAEEHTNASKMKFEQMDSDKDGFVTKAEMAAGHHKMMGKMSDKMSDRKTDKMTDK